MKISGDLRRHICNLALDYRNLHFAHAHRNETGNEQWAPFPTVRWDTNLCRLSHTEKAKVVVGECVGNLGECVENVWRSCGQSLEEGEKTKTNVSPSATFTMV